MTGFDALSTLTSSPAYYRILSHLLQKDPFVRNATKTCPEYGSPHKNREMSDDLRNEWQTVPQAYVREPA